MLTAPQAKLEIDRLTALLNRASEVYYNSGETLMDDEQFDLGLAQLAELEAQFPQLARPDSPNLRIGTEVSGEFPKKRHHTPMLSLENISQPEELEKWGERVLKELDGGTPVFCAEAKLDGLSMSVVYRQGKLVEAVTRGNGEIGDEVTRNIRQLKNLPESLAEPLDLELRGEVLLSKAAFKALNDRLADQGEERSFKNPRNAAAGSLRLKDSAEVALRGLEILLYDLVTPGFKTNHEENLALMESWGLPVNPYRKRTGDLAEVLAFCRQMEAQRGELPFEIDGVVVKIDQLEQRARMGRTLKFPVWARAWKFRAERKPTLLLEVENSMGRTGVLTPVAQVEKVSLAGTDVRRASLHNYQQVCDVLGLHYGDRVYLEKGGDIIPKVVGVDLSARKADAKPYLAPTDCPACGQLLQRLPLAGKKPKEGEPPELEVDLRCLNPQCPAVLLGRVEHFVSKKAMDIKSLGGKSVELLMKHGFIQGVDQFFELKDRQGELLELDGLGEISVSRLLEGIEEAKHRPLNHLIFGLGIPNVGEKASKVLALHCGDLEGFLGLNTESMESIGEVGPVLAASVATWLSFEPNQALVRRLMALGVEPERLERPSNQPFKGQSVCLTGTLSEKRSDWKFRLEQLGFQVTSAVSKKTNYLLAGAEAGSKLKKAQELGVEILDESQMRVLISLEET